MAHCDAVGWSRPHHQVDPGKRRRELAQISGRRADEARELPEAPMGRRDRSVGVGQDQRQPLGIIPVRLDADPRALDGARPAALGAPLHRGEEVVQRQIALVVGPGKPFRGHAAHPFPARYIHLVAAALGAGGHDLD